MSYMGDRAIQYARAGFPIFPLCWPDPANDYKCGCGRNHEGGNIGKVPLTVDGLKSATTNIGLVQDWWQRWPKANIAYAIRSDQFILDVDVGHNGFESLETLQYLIGNLTETLLITTGGGGHHYYYKTPRTVRNTTRLAGLEGLDIRGTGGYVVVPPSLHRSGSFYEKSPVWPGPITEAPTDLLELVTSNNRQSTGQTRFNEPSGVLSEGTRNAGLASLAGSLRAKGMSEDAILAALLSFNQQQCRPPLSDREVETISKSYGRYPAGNLDSYRGNKQEQSDFESFLHGR